MAQFVKQSLKLKSGWDLSWAHLLPPAGAAGAGPGWRPGGWAGRRAAGGHLAGLGQWAWPTAGGAAGEGARWRWGGGTAEASALETLARWRGWVRGQEGSGVRVVRGWWGGSTRSTYHTWCAFAPGTAWWKRRRGRAGRGQGAPSSWCCSASRD